MSVKTQFQTQKERFKMALEGTILHIILHITTILVAFGLFILSAISYSRDRRVKFLYISGSGSLRAHPIISDLRQYASYPKLRWREITRDT